MKSFKIGSIYIVSQTISEQLKYYAEPILPGDLIKVTNNKYIDGYITAINLTRSKHHLFGIRKKDLFQNKLLKKLYNA